MAKLHLLHPTEVRFWGIRKFWFDPQSRVIVLTISNVTGSVSIGESRFSCCPNYFADCGLDLLVKLKQFCYQSPQNTVIQKHRADEIGNEILTGFCCDKRIRLEYAKARSE